MKKFFIFIILILAVVVIGSLYLNSPKAILSKIDIVRLNLPSVRLNYRIYLFGVFPVGSAVLEDRGLKQYNGIHQRHLNAKAYANDTIVKFYPFAVNIDSYLDSNTLLPLSFRQIIQTKDKNTVKEVNYDQAKNIMEIFGEKRGILPETYEPLSAVYKLRRMDLDKLSGFDLNINTNQKNYAFSGDIKKDDIQIKKGTVRIYKLKGKIFRRDKNPYHQSQVDFVLAGAQGKVPVYIKVLASGGLITVRLTGIE